MNDRLRRVALGQEPADLILKNASIVDVFTESLYEGDVAIADGFIAGVGSYAEAEKIIDCSGRVVAPGLINAHCHVESSMAVPEAYVQEELRWGVTTLITDPHEIANVKGSQGILYMLKAGGNMPVNYYVEVPSCVPATPFEHAGCVMGAGEMSALMQEPGILGMGEMMNVPGVLQADPEVMEKLRAFTEAGRVVDGHAPCVSGRALQAYVGAGIDTDHESISWAEAQEKLRSGVAVLVREGSASRNLRNILEGALPCQAATGNMAFCTDDKHLADIRREGTIRHCVQLAIELGMKAEKALAMASLNAARIYGLKHLGAIAAGYQADIVVFDNLEQLVPQLVLHKGRNACQEAMHHAFKEPPQELLQSVNIAGCDASSFNVEKFMAGRLYPVIRMLPGEIFTEKGSIKGEDVAGALAKGELCMISVVERHHATGNISLGLLSGYGLREGAAATTVGHDSHNLLVVGTNAADMLAAVQELQRCQGGYTLVQSGKVVETLPLQVAGLMSTAPTEELCAKLELLAAQAHAIGVVEGVDPFISLSFMALPVIPKIRITDVGMFDAENFCFYENM